MTLEPILPVEPDAWNAFVAAHPAAHILQTSAWSALKAQFGWEDERVALAQGERIVAGAQMLYRRLPAGLGRLAYVPKGPLVDWSDAGQTQALLAALDRAALTRGAIALTVEPDLADEAIHRERLRACDLHPSPLDSVQPRRTIVVDISPGEGAILAAMKQKTRYNVRLAARKGVTVREATETDLPAFHALTAATGARDRFGVHAPAYYEAAYRLFVPRGWARLLLAEVEGEPAAAAMAFALPPRAWYFYGASGNAHREKMPTYLLCLIAGFCGGVLLLLGAGLAHGCITGQFISGWTQLSLSAIPFTITLFGFGMLAAYLVYPKAPNRFRREE